MPDVFISHADEDHAAAVQLCGALEAAGLRSWIAPRDIAPGAAWADAIVEAIQGCRGTVVLVSRNSMASRQVAREVELSDNASRPILAVRLDNSEVRGGLSYFLLNTQWHDATDGNWPRVADAVRDLLTPDALEDVDDQIVPVRASPFRSVMVELQRLAAAWFGIVARGPRFIETIETEDVRTVVFAGRFMVYMNMISAALSIALVRSAQSNPAHYVFSHVVSGAVETFGAILIFHAAFRLLGGAGALAASATVCFLYTAFEPVLGLVLAPARFYLEPFFRLDLRTATPAQVTEALTRYTASIAVVVLLACFAAATIVMTAAMVSVAKSMGATHRLATGRTIVAMIVSVAAYLVYVLIVGTAFEGSMYP